jgi:oxygen-dependent protoporphyrinogen oxidase
MVDRLGEPLLAGIHAGDPERLSMRATFPRFVELEARHGSLIRGLRAAAPPRHPGASAFYSLAGGLEEMAGALAASLPAGSLSPASPVRSLRREAEGFRLELEEGGTLLARAVALAAPAPSLAALLEPIDAEAALSLRAIRFASTATVLLGYRREQVRHALDGYGLVVPRTEGLRTAACSFFSTKFPGRAPAGHVLLRGFLGGIRDPEVLEHDDAALGAIVVREMGPVLGLQGEPALTRVYRWPSGTPQMEVGHLERMRDLEARLARVPGLFITGAGIRVTGIPDTIADGLATGSAAGAYTLS